MQSDSKKLSTVSMTALSSVRERLRAASVARSTTPTTSWRKFGEFVAELSGADVCTDQRTPGRVVPVLFDVAELNFVKVHERLVLSGFLGVELNEGSAK
jgi:hypothetical protein